MAPFASLSIPVIDSAARWFLHSGIQESNGGVARYFLSDSGRNAAISTEITGYAISTLAWMHSLGVEGCLQPARSSARFLLDEAWCSEAQAMPFELEGAPPLSYFFDCGIIARGLLTLYRQTNEAVWLAGAQRIADSMLRDFPRNGEIQPIIRLNDKLPIVRDGRWSRNPGCYQLKSSLAWFELYKTTGNTDYQQAFERNLASSLATHREFLPESSADRRVMDRLHAYCYFLEALLLVTGRPECRAALAWGIERVGLLLRQLSAQFQRSDVCAQLLRVRLAAELLADVRIDFEKAAEEAAWSETYRCSHVPATQTGGFWFGRADGALLPFVNPVSTAFCAQALEWWRCYQDGSLTIAPASII